MQISFRKMLVVTHSVFHSIPTGITSPERVARSIQPLLVVIQIGRIWHLLSHYDMRWEKQHQMRWRSTDKGMYPILGYIQQGIIDTKRLILPYIEGLMRKKMTCISGLVYIPNSSLSSNQRNQSDRLLELFTCPIFLKSDLILEGKSTIGEIKS